jgi:hypothetical protein
MLQKFTQKTTFYYKQFNDLGNLYASRGQNRTAHYRLLQAKYLFKNDDISQPIDIKKPAEAGSLYIKQSTSDHRYVESYQPYASLRQQLNR